MRLNRPIWPSLFIGYQAPPGWVPRAAAAARVHRSPCVAAAHVRRPPRVDASPSSMLRWSHRLHRTGCHHRVPHHWLVPLAVVVQHDVQAGDDKEDEDAVMSEVREQGGLGFHHDVTIVLIPPCHPLPPVVPRTDRRHRNQRHPMPRSTVVFLRGLD
jgi:hypothetical protein